MQREFTTPFEEIFPKELNKCLQKFYLSARKRDGRSAIARQNCNEIFGNSKLKIIILVLNYLTVLVLLKQLFISVSVAISGYLATSTSVNNCYLLV